MMTYGIIVVLIIMVLVAYVIVQETRAQLHWRGLAESGDIDAIRELIEVEVEHWHTSRVPKGTPALLWHGVQTAELLDVTPDGARLSCDAEGEYMLSGGRRVESSSALDEGKKVTMKLAEMALYDVPNVKLDHVQIDVYTSFRDDSGKADTRCILSTLVKRRQVELVDWDEMAANDFVSLNEGRFAEQTNGALHAVEPLPWVAAEPARSNEDALPLPDGG